jgi:hypothetical protein
MLCVFFGIFEKKSFRWDGIRNEMKSRKGKERKG